MHASVAPLPLDAEPALHVHEAELALLVLPVGHAEHWLARGGLYDPARQAAGLARPGRVAARRTSTYVSAARTRGRVAQETRRCTETRRPSLAVRATDASCGTDGAALSGHATGVHAVTVSRLNGPTVAHTTRRDPRGKPLPVQTSEAPEPELA